MYNREKKVFVIGHKNPDTDSICSAISYAYLKNAVEARNQANAAARNSVLAQENTEDIQQHIEEEAGGLPASGGADALPIRYLPMRAGHINQETQYVLDYFHVNKPELITDVSPQIQDIEIRMLHGISEDVSLNTAYRIMKEQQCVTLPVLDAENHLRGVITINDIAESAMDMYDNRIVGNARTPVKNIVATVDGKLLCGNAHAQITRGKVVVAASSEAVMNDFLLEDDLVIAANRSKAQMCAIKNKASCLIVCGPTPIKPEIVKYAKENQVIVIATAHDTYVTSRLINHSMPVRRFMCAHNLVTFHLTDSVEEASEVMAKYRFRDFPILDANGRYVGMVSRRNVLGLRRKQIIMVDHNEMTQAVDGAENADILEIIDHHRLGTIETTAPVYFRCQPLGCTATIVYQLYTEQGIEIPKDIAGLLCSAILSDTLMFRSPTCTPVDKQVAERLAKIAGIQIEPYTKAMFNAGSNLKNKTAEEIFFQDFKRFSVGENNFGVGQINSMNEEDFPEIIKKLRPYMEEQLTQLKLNSIYFLLTGILSETSEVICCGKEAVPDGEEAFHAKAKNDVLHLEGVVSRKKQFVPPLVELLQQRK